MLRACPFQSPNPELAARSASLCSSPGLPHLQRCDQRTAAQTAGAASARLRPQIMAVTADELAQLEERLLAKLQGQPSRVEEEEEELPAAVFARVTCVTTILLVYVCVSMVASIFTTGVHGNLSQIEYCVYPLCFTAFTGLIFGALDSEAAGRRTIKLMRAWWIPQIVIVPYLYWTSDMYVDAVLLFIGFSINSIFWPWLFGAMREILRKRYQGSRTAWSQHYTSRALKLGAFQIVLAVSAIAQGLEGKESFPRVYATFNFSLNLSTVLIFVIAIFDVCAVDTRAAATLRLSPLQAAAVVTCGIVVLSAFAGYIVSEQRRPSKRAARAAFLSMVFSNQFCFIVVGRLVWVARRKARSEDSASVVPAKEEGLEAGVFDVPGA